MNVKEKDSEYIAGTYARFPLNIVSGKGSLVYDENGKEYKTFCRAHNFKGVAQRYERLANLLEGDELRVGKILQADCHLVECKPMWEKANAKYIECPHYFIDEVNE